MCASFSQIYEYFKTHAFKQENQICLLSNALVPVSALIKP